MSWQGRWGGFSLLRVLQKKTLRIRELMLGMVDKCPFVLSSNELETCTTILPASTILSGVVFPMP